MCLSLQEKMRLPLLHLLLRFLEKLLLHPLGPYWYLHTLVLCGAIWYVSLRCTWLKMVSRGLLAGMSLYALSTLLDMVSFPHAMFFLVGAMMRRTGVSFTRVFVSSSLSVVGLALLSLSPDNLNCATLGGVLMVWLSISACLFA